MTIKKLTVSCYNFLTARGDRLRFLKRIAKICKPLTDKGVRLGSRIFYLHTWGMDKSEPDQPWAVIGQWNAGYGGAKDLPVFDLTKWNESYWENFRRIHGWLRDLGFIACGALEDFCSLKKEGRDKYHHPIRSNVQRWPEWATGRADNAAIPDSWYGKGMRPYYRAYFKRVVQELRALKIPFELEIMNEADVEAMPESTLLDWHKWATDLLVSCRVPKASLIASASRAQSEIAKTVGTFSAHGIARPDQIKPDYFGIPRPKIELSSDGGSLGHGRADYKGRRGASWAEMRGIARRMEELGYGLLETWDRGIEGKAAMSAEALSGVWANVDLFNGGALAAFVEEATKL